MKNKFKKQISLILTLITLISLIGFNRREVKADIPNKPSFDLEMTASPNPALIGEDITVSGVIKPKDFETEIPAKEIVLVLDTSGSMDGNKMKELKTAAKGFIETMKSVENLKIAIVQYSSLATINPTNVIGDEEYYTLNRNDRNPKVPKYNSSGEDFINIDSQELNSMIDNLKAEGGTNIGEGMRRAIYMLEKEKSTANKTIVLMTDGLPTFYSAKSGVITYDNWKKGWSKDRNGKYNVSWSIGISEDIIKRAFENWSTYVTDRNYSFDNWKNQWSEWKNLSKSEETKVKEAFSDYVSKYIGKNISNYYDIDNVQPYYIGGNGSSLDNNSLAYAEYMGKIIKEKGYNAYSVGYGMDTQGNTTFKKIHKSMTGNELNNDKVKNEEKGYYQTSDNISGIFNNIATEIMNSYPVNNLALNISFSDGFTLNVGGNKVEIGNISYSKTTGSSSTSKVKYTAKEIPFSFIVKASKAGQQTINSKVNISYVFNNEDLNHDVGESLSINIESNELPKIGASLVSEKNLTLTKGDEFNVKYKLSPQDFEFKDINNATEKDVILLIDNSSLVNNNAFNSLKNSTFNKLLNNTTLVNLKTSYAVITFSDKAELLSGFTTNITSLNDNVIKNINQNSSKEANLDKAIDLVKTALNGGRSDATKNIIIMAQDNVTYSKAKIEELENKGYNIIILSLGNGQTTSLTSLKDNKNLAIESESIFITGNDGNNVENTYMAKVAERLISSTKYKSYIFNPEITLSLLNNFEIVKGATTVNGNTVKIVSDKKVVYNNIGNNKYNAEPIEIEFTVKVKGENTGIFNLGTALLRHENLLGNHKEIILETPKVTVKEEVKDLVHGLYSGLLGSEVIIEKSIDENAFKMIGGSTVTFGAKFKTTSDKIKATINIDSKFDITHGEFRVYKVVKGSDKTSLIELKQVDNLIRTNYLDITIDGIDAKNLETEVVIVYKVKLKDESENERFENKINAGRLSEKVNIYTPLGNSNLEDDSIEKLPDLF